jgi:ATP-dependent Clp protease ATP-binding subunit ClpA
LVRVDLDRLSVEELDRVARAHRDRLAIRTGLALDEKAIAHAVDSPAIGDAQAHPGLAIRRLENLAIEAATEAGSAETDIRSMGGVERSLTNPTGRTTAAELARVVKSRVKGQDEAIETMCRVVARASFGVDFRPERPNGVFLLNGPTGVGKTTAAIELARALGVELVRVDLGEYQEDASIQRLAGVCRLRRSTELADDQGVGIPALPAASGRDR